MASVHVVELGTYDALADFLSHAEGGGESPELIHQWFQLWWDANPAFQAGMKRGWVLKEAEKVVGFVGNVPSALQIAGQTVTSYSATTWRVLSDYRNQTMALVFQWLALGKSAVLFATTPTQDVVKILQASRFRLLPPAENHDVSVLIVNSRAVITAMTGEGLLADLAGLLGGVAAGQFQKFVSRRVRSADTTPIRRFCQADALFDDLWERTKSLFPNTNIRNSSWINWYCFQPPNSGKLLLGYVTDGRLRAYAICQPKKHDKLKLLECADFWVEPNIQGALPALVHSIDLQARQDGYDLVLFPHFTQSYGAELTALGLPTKTFKVKTNYFKASAGMDLSDGNSYFVGAQGDYGLG